MLPHLERKDHNAPSDLTQQANDEQNRHAYMRTDQHQPMNNVRFGGYLCGAGNATLYGESCRTCFTDLHEAQEVERRLRLGEAVGMNDIDSEDALDDLAEERGMHVVMCDTLKPPPSPSCTRKCHVKTDTVSRRSMWLWFQQTDNE